MLDVHRIASHAGFSTKLYEQFCVRYKMADDDFVSLSMCGIACDQDSVRYSFRLSANWQIRFDQGLHSDLKPVCVVGFDLKFIPIEFWIVSENLYMAFDSVVIAHC